MRFALLIFAAATIVTAQSPAKVAIGKYECWANNRPRLLLNFSIKNATQYTDSNDKPGNYTYDSKTTRIVFKGGGLDGVLPNGFYTIYHEPHGNSTVSFRNSQGNEVSFCEKKK